MKILILGFLTFIASSSFAESKSTFRDLRESSGDQIIIQEQMIVPKYDGYNQYAELIRNQNDQGEGCVLIADPMQETHSFDPGHAYEISKVNIEFDSKSKLFAFGILAKSFWHTPKKMLLVCYSKTNDLSLDLIQKKLQNKVLITIKHSD